MDITSGTLKSQAQALKDRLCVAVDEYLAHYEKAQTEKALKIDQVEEYLVELKAQTNRLFNETTTEMLAAMESDLTEKKTFALIVEKR
jgi:hypothetical protein